MTTASSILPEQSGPSTMRTDVQTELAEQIREVKVLVTGFGPWGYNTFNPSYPMTALLPTSFTIPIPISASHPSSRPAQRSVKVQILRPAFPLLVEFPPIASLAWPLLTNTRPDLVLHVGLAAGRTFFGAEKSSSLPWSSSSAGTRQAWKDALQIAWPGQTEDGGAAWPDRLETSLSYDRTIARWKHLCADQGLPNNLTRESDDVGDFLCGFISYLTHARAWYDRSRGKREFSDHSSTPTAAQDGEPLRSAGKAALPGTHTGGPALFLHVPPGETELDLVRGKIIIMALLQSMVEVWLEDQHSGPA